MLTAKAMIYWSSGALALALLAAPATAQTRGMIVDNSTKKAIVFNADTDTVLGSVSIASSGGGIFGAGDCTISQDQTLGFATDFLSNVWVINLSPVFLASGTNPMYISNHGEDTSLSPNGNHVVVCDGAAIEPVSVIDIASRAQISTLLTGSLNCNSVDVAGNGSVLVTSHYAFDVRRLTIDSLGLLTDTGEVLPAGGDPNNVVVAPGGSSGVVITGSQATMKSFTVPGLVPVDTRALGGVGISGAINPAGDRLFVRDNGAFVSAYAYNSATGAIGAAPLYSIPISGALAFYGMDQLAVHPNGAKLYVSQPGAVNVYDTSTGTFLTSMTDAAISGPSGICLPRPGPVCTAPVITGAAATPSSLWPPNHNMVDITVGYTTTSNCPTTCTLSVASNEPINGTGDGDTAPDWVILDANHVQLRAERAATGSGRIYTITITCTNTAAQSSSRSVTVIVPASQG